MRNAPCHDAVVRRAPKMGKEGIGVFIFNLKSQHGTRRTDKQAKLI
jgi:hypothetical protein